ncbi:MAG: right-handed parallel beta-helix repeat-containing protein [Phenylobacterium sp.]|uniref:right-handed parallel beta-helix repeat-containing protein n=1 Tax=Phenylobacterium sp. TaxID=1871053 RepID=UPI0027336FF6|nr:right-handed parallel beta-helix repeat-containing protein [Phenylobacterium sp.]MDP3746269.1 right-handed parallel beta-helix repeat-containing protein [Phenylobacterium sp.]
MSTITASTTTQLIQALKVAQSGDTIFLTPGTYSNVTLSYLKIAGDVTITSADPNRQATFTDLTVRDSSGLNFSNLEFVVDPAISNGFKVLNSSDIQFDKLNVHGTLDGDPTNDSSAMQIRGSSSVSVTNSEFQQLSNGLSHLDSEHITISGNKFHDIQIDGVRGGGSSFVTISNNHFTDFYREDGNHPDAIQFWTSNTTTSAHDIVIANNVIDRGDGGPMQGIFLKDESGGRLPYHNVTITGNVIVGSMWNGISVNGADGLTISNNIVAGFADMKARIALKDTVDVTLTNNQATDYIRVDIVQMTTDTGNIRIAVPTDGGMAILNLWMDNHPSSIAAELYDTSVSAPSEDTATTTPPPTTPTIGYKSGSPGADTLTDADGSTTMAGGAGDDVYVVGKATTVITELSGAGQDLVKSSVSFTLGANVEDLTLTGTGNINGVGNELNNYITGNDGSNHLVGGAGDDTLESRGGTDLLEGGAGNDTYVVNANASVVEAAGAGIDTVKSMYGITMSANVENAILINKGGAGVVGNALNNEITGNVGTNRLSGGAGADTIDGGAGADVLLGETGNDVLTGGDGADRFIFGRGSGNDVITDFGVSGARESIDYSAYAKAGVKLTIIDLGADTLIQFDTGNSIRLTGVDPHELQSTGTNFVING